jgi:hypothetical protein
MRPIRFLVPLLLSACAGAPPPPAAAPKQVVAVQQEAPPPPAPPEPLASEDVTLTQKSEFLALGVGSVKPDLMSDEDLVASLPAAAKAQWLALDRARNAAQAADRKAGNASAAYYGCDGCRDGAARKAKYDAAQRAASRARDDLRKAADRAKSALDKQLASPKAVPAIAIALARLQLRGDSPIARDSFEWSAEYGESTSDLPGIDALERALPLASAGEEMGQRVRRELLLRLRASARASLADRLIAELLPNCPITWRAELHFRRGLFQAMNGRHAKAAESFEKALGLHVPGSTVSRGTLASGVLLARYRALDFQRALAAGIRVIDEMGHPEPPPPAPPPPPPVKPKAKSKAVSARLAALADAAEFGMLGLLSTSGGSALSEHAVLRLAADSVERLDLDPIGLEGPPAARAGILSDLAVRALYRGDVERAKRYARAAREVGSLAETRNALDVLRMLALDAGDTDGAKGLANDADDLGWSGVGGYLGSGESVEGRDLGARLAAARATQAGAAKERRDDEPPVARTVRSALRACIEPVRTRLPSASGSGKERRIGTLTLQAKVFEDGHADVSVNADRDEEGLGPVLDCLQKVGPRLLAHAPSSVHATVVLDESLRHAHSGWGFGGIGLSSLSAIGDENSGIMGLIGNSIGESQGFGGLGLRGTGTGGGGTGQAIGIGSIGGIGRGGGTGVGYGIKKHSPKKKPAAKKSEPPKK